MKSRRTLQPGNSKILAAGGYEAPSRRIPQGRRPFVPYLFSRAALALAAFAAVPSYGIDLVDSYLAAKNHDAIIASAQAAHTSGVEVLQQAQAKLGATLQATGSASLLQTHLLGYPPATGYTSQGLLSLDQPLFRRTDSIAADQAQSQVTRLDSVLYGAEQDLVLRVAQTYLNALLAQDLLEATILEKKSISEQLERARRSFEVGTAPVTDVTDTQSRYDISIANEARDRGNLEIAQRAFEVLMGIPPESLAGVVIERTVRPPEPADLNYWLSAARDRNPGVVQATATLDVQQKQIDRTRAAWYPTIDLVASASKQTFSEANLNVLGTGGKVAEIGVQVSWTLWDSGMRSSELRQATAGADQAAEDLRTSKNVAVEGARQNYIGVTSAITEVGALEQAAVAGRISLEGAIRGLEAGTRTAIDVLNARQLLFQTLRNLANARYSEVLQMLQLKSMVGTLTVHDLEGITSASAPAGLFASEPPIPH
jgi:outer membrane protein